MHLERDYVLKRMDEWHSGLLREKYTQEVANELIFRLHESLKGTETLEVIVKQGLSEQFSPDKFCSMTEATLSQIDLMGSSYESILKEYPEELRESYAEDIKFYHDLFSRIVSEFRKKSDEVFPDELTNEDMKNIYLQVMGGIDGAVHIGKQLLLIANVGIEHNYKKGNMSENSCKYLHDLNNALSEELPFLYGKLFEN